MTTESLWIIPFGKHKNMPIEDIPYDYLLWLTEQDWFIEKFPEGCAQIGKEMAYRDKFGAREEHEDRNWNRNSRKS